MTEIGTSGDVAAMDPSTSATIAQNSMRTFLARVLVTALSIVTGIVTAKWLGPAGKGVYSGEMMLISIVMVVPAGIAGAIIYELTKQRRSLADVLPAAGALLLAITAASWLGAMVWALVRGWNPVLLIFVAAVPPSVVLAWQGSFYIALGRLRNLNIQSIGIALATLAAVTLTIVVFHGGAIAALAAWLACLYAAAAVVSWHILHLGRGPSRVALGPTVRGLMRFGGQSAFNLFLGQVNYRIDSIILIAILGAGSFGVYSIAVNFGELMFMITRPITAAVTRDIGIRSPSSSALITAKVIRILTAMAAAASIIAFVFGPFVIGAIYGWRFHGAGAPLRILLPGIVAFSTAGTFAAFFILQLGRPLINSVIAIAMIVIQAIMCFAFVPRFGMSGAALASTITYIAGALMNTWWFCRVTKVPARDVWILRPSDIQTVRDAIAEITGRASRLQAGGAEGTARSRAR